MEIIWILLCVYFVTSSDKNSNLIVISGTECYSAVTNPCDPASVTLSTKQCKHVYSAEYLKLLRDRTLHSKQLRTIPTRVCDIIRKLRIQKRKERGYRPKPKKNKLLNQSRVNHTNLVQIKTKGSHPIKDNRHRLIKGSVVNAQSVKNKADRLIEYYDDSNLDFLVITETWLKCNDTDKIWLECSALVSSGRTVDYYNDRKNRPSAGIAIISSQSVHVKCIKSGVTRSFQYCIWQLKYKSTEVSIVAVYRPPYAARTNPVTDSQFLDDLFEWFVDVVPVYKNLVICGDINLHLLNDDDPNSDTFNTSLDALGLIQHVSFTTHTKGNMLDVVVSEINSRVEVTNCTRGPLLSDHHAIEFNLSIVRDLIQTEEICYRNSTKLDKDKFCDLISGDMTSLVNDVAYEKDLNGYVSKLNSILSGALDKLAPVQTKI